MIAWALLAFLTISAPVAVAAASSAGALAPAPGSSGAEVSLSSPRMADSERLTLIQKRGALIVGLKTDYAPFGGLNAQGQSEGLEHDLAADVARRLGVSRQSLYGILEGYQAVKAAMALRLGRLFGNAPSFWLNLQS
ncbi:MAG: hypothetical protein ACO26U_14265, partial [Burkholderiaceae bacterium]